MNIEEASIADTLKKHAAYIGHIHFADSNRQAMGLGHTQMADIASAIKETNY